ncbi:MAG: M20/M25/M40 family metallo-hydrolase, partial [Solirubrobacteraceae bacterium]
AAEAARVAGEAGVRLDLRTAARSAGTTFPEDVRAALLRGLPPGAPRLVCFAGHDAGVIAEHRPAGMVLVRNETGISHAPEEEVSLDDAAVAANALLAAAVHA